MMWNPIQWFSSFITTSITITPTQQQHEQQHGNSQVVKKHASKSSKRPRRRRDRPPEQIQRDNKMRVLRRTRRRKQQLQTRLEKLDQQHLQHQVEAAFKNIAARFDSILKRFGYKHDHIITVQLCFFLLAQADPVAKINAARVVREILRRVKGPISEHFAQVEALEHQQHHSQFPQSLLDDQGWKTLCTIVNIRLSVFPLLAPFQFD